MTDREDLVTYVTQQLDAAGWAGPTLGNMLDHLEEQLAAAGNPGPDDPLTRLHRTVNAAYAKTLKTATRAIAVADRAVSVQNASDVEDEWSRTASANADAAAGRIRIEIAGIIRPGVVAVNVQNGSRTAISGFHWHYLTAPGRLVSEYRLVDPNRQHVADLQAALADAHADATIIDQPVDSGGRLVAPTGSTSTPPPGSRPSKFPTVTD